VDTDTRLREVFHLLFLERLLKVAEPALFVLKGGVNLRFYFHSPRYSEDMDLDVLGGAVSTLKKNGYKILDDASFLRVLVSYGIARIEVNDTAKAKHTETTQRFRVNLINTAGRKLPTKVEFSRRAVSDEPFLLEALDPAIARQYRRLAFTVQHYSGEAAVMQKIRALAGRPATQARDIFDLEILYRGGYWAQHQILAQLDQTSREQALAAAMAISFQDYTNQVVEFLELEHRNEYGTESAWKDMQNRVAALLAGKK
jgi:predicted nucleotidyltransferase component of viral defense system